MAGLDSSLSIGTAASSGAATNGDVRPLAVLWRLLGDVPRRQQAMLAVLMVAGALTEGLGLFTLVPLLSLLDDGGATGGMATRITDALGFAPSLGALLALFLGLVLLRGLVAVALGQVQARAQHDVTARLGERCFAALVRAEWRWLAGTHSADHRATLLTHIGLAGAGLALAGGLISALILAVGTLGVALVLSWQTTVAAMLAGAVMILALAGFRRRAVVLGEAVRLAQRDLHRDIQRSLSALRLTKLFDNETQESSAFAAALAAVHRAKVAHVRDSLWTTFIFQVGGATILVLVVGLGVSLWGLGLAVLLPLVLAIARMVPLLSGLHQGWHGWLHVMPSIAEVQALTDEAERAAEPAGAGHAPIRLDTAIRIEQVSVRYAGRARPALEAVSATIAARRTTAITGASGSGKSTLADAIMGLIEPDAGGIFIDGVALSGPARRQWRHAVAYVQQDPILFHGSIRDNLRWAAPAADEAELASVLRMAAAEFVFELPDGLDTIVGDNGVLLSGGERQRLCLARALLRRPALLILDEATSAVDSESEAAIRRAIRHLHGEVTCILIGHRSALIEDADAVIELAKGLLVASRSAEPVSS